ncbi:MerR family transcriptional regulator [Aminipila luticellarii]|uniref:MerR family transcriptional regulator n=1 Tax=Aminipila luticellarii TaxID=2507160 RepID=A0A410PU03_9FIRM|nr:MerR family transcriptional regulator [Aminipila luticellarii]QAT42358.1 MerR family transcriptional regulator [Aminipila luticellarii]
MEEKEYYSIGEVSKICNISKKALRFYDKIGIISPDKVCDDNNYRFYNRTTLLSLPVIKYYKQMGFKLEEMRELFEGNTYGIIERQFRRKIDELKELEENIHNSYTSVKDWYDLILEAQLVIENDVHEVAVKYIDATTYCFMDQAFEYNYRESIINIEWTNYLESINNEITGPVVLSFPSFKEKMDGTCQKVRIMQEPILEYKEEQVTKMGGYMVASCYHIGSLESIHETYQKICNWADSHGYICTEECYERYVTDYWTTRNEDQFVTEVMIQVTRG